MKKDSIDTLWHPCTQMKFHEDFPPLVIQHGKGVYLFDAQNRSYIDGISSWWVNLFGHQNSRIKSAIVDQLDHIEHVMLAGLSHPPVIELSRQLSALTNYQLGHAFFASDGASATEIALKMSAHYWRNQGFSKKHQFVALKNSYHGETLGALGVTDVSLFRDAYADLIHFASLIAVPQWGHDEDIPSCLLEFETYLQAHHQETAALIVEPLVQAAAGMRFYSTEFLEGLAKLCLHYDVHLIVDEIAMGFGRTGKMFAYQHTDIKPDFICLSKGITGGFLPLSAVLTTDEIYQAFYHQEITYGFLHSHSYTGNPLACRAALEVLAIFEQEKVLENNQKKQSEFIQLAAPLIEHPHVNAFRQLGMIWVFDVATTNTRFSRDCYQAGLKYGILIRPIGNQLYLMPPYCITSDEFSQLVAGTVKALNEVCL